MPPARRLLGYLDRYRRAFLLGFLSVVTTTALSLTGPWVLKYAIDDLYAGRDDDRMCPRWRPSKSTR